MLYFLFFFNDTATTEIYTLSLHDALPICTSPARGGPLQGPPRSPCHGVPVSELFAGIAVADFPRALEWYRRLFGDRKSTRLNSSHANISYAVFCLKKKKNDNV